MKRKLTIRPRNRLLILGMALAFVVFAGTAAYSAYWFEREKELLRCENARDILYDEYRDKAYALSDVYAPIFRTETNVSAMRGYFCAHPGTVMDAYFRAALLDVVSQMLDMDPDIDFIVLHNPDLPQNVWVQRDERSLALLPEDFPFIPRNGGYSLHGSMTWYDSRGHGHDAFVIQGGTYSLGAGSILVGYSLEPFQSALSRTSASDAAVFLLLAGDQVVFDSSGQRYGQTFDTAWITPDKTWQYDGSTAWCADLREDTGRNFSAAYLFPPFDLLKLSNTNTWRIVLIMLAFMAFYVVVYILSTRHILHRVFSIREGLQALGANKLDVRLEVTPHQDEFDDIAENINAMAETLEKNVEKEYEMRLRQVQLELRQIQARFNPHFLYNTLELIRGQLYERGNAESAAYLEKLSRIFRNLTSSKSFVSIQEEISFCTVYASLLELRYENAVSVSYDIAPELLECGVLSNLIQPVIENYFVHALDENADSNELEISCQPEGDDHICFRISNNGAGLTPERMKELNAQLRAPDMSARSYGLMSIARRTLLFYGADCGIRLQPNPSAPGICVEIRIRRMTLEEHGRKLMYYK